MTPEYVLSLAQTAFMIIGMIAGPIILSSLVVGLIVALFQAATQVNEATLSFVPKLILTACVILFAGHWMIEKILNFMSALYMSIPTVVMGH